MMMSLKNYWVNLSVRERRLLMVAGVLASALLLWLIMRPAMSWSADLQASHRAAVEREGRVKAKALLLRTSASDLASAQAVGLGGAAIDQYLAQSASEIGLSLTRNDARGASGASIAIANGKAQVVSVWLAELERQGLVLDNLTLTPQLDGSLAVTADLRVIQP